MKNIRPPIPGSCLPSLAKLIKSCWAVNPEERPRLHTLSNIIGHKIDKFLFKSFKEVVFLLDDIIVDVHLTHEEGRQYIEEGRKFWKVRRTLV